VKIGHRQDTKQAVKWLAAPASTAMTDGWHLMLFKYKSNGLRVQRVLNTQRLIFFGYPESPHSPARRLLITATAEKSQDRPFSMVVWRL
jgi:hypothetical protein